MKGILALALVVALIFTISRFVWLDLDPPLTKRINDVSDEGYWLHNARIKVLTGEFRHDHFNQALFTAPLYTFLAYAVFKAVGVSLANGRLLAAWSGVLVILIGFLFFLLICRSLAWACSYALLMSVSDLFFAYNRIGLVETTLNLFVLLSFMSLAVAFQSPRSGRYIFVSGACFGIAFLVKFTAAYTLVAFPLLVMFEALAGNRRKPVELLSWVAGAATVILPPLGLLYWRYPGELVKYLGIYSPAIAGSSRGWYSPLVRFIFNPMSVIQNEFVNTLSVTLLFLMLLTYFAVIYRRTGYEPVAFLKGLSVFERLCLAWITGTILSTAYADMQSDRRYWGVLIPATVIVSKFVADCFGSVPARAEMWKAPTSPLAIFVHGRVSVLSLLACLYAMVYSAAPLLATLGAYALQGAGVPFRAGIVQTGSLLVAGIAAVWATARRVPPHPWYFVIVPIFAFGIDWNLALLFPGLYSRMAHSMVWITAIALTLAHGFYVLHRKGPRSVLGTLLVAYLAWNGAVIVEAFRGAQASVKSAAREVDQLITQEEPSGRYYIAGGNAHQLALESESLPLFLGVGKFYTDLTKGLSEYPWEPRYFLQRLSPHRRGALPVMSDTALPSGLEGHVLGRFCMYESSITGYCRYPFAVVKLSSFSLSEFLRGTRG